MKYSFTPIILIAIFIAGSAEFLNAGEQWTCGFAYTSQEVRSVTHFGQLRKPAQGVRDFYIRSDLSATKDIQFDAVSFTLVDSTSQVEFYLQTSVHDTLSQFDINSFLEPLKERMFESLPTDEFSGGFYDAEIELFGEPPDVDNNGKIFILMMDIQDEYDPETGGNYVAGYFDPLDQYTSGQTSNASENVADILYIDTHPGLTNNFSQTITTVAHELQHLLHFGADPGEFAWLNEGMSEVTAHLFNLQARPFSFYLDNPNRTLTRFEYDDENVVADYAKVSLWTLYLYYRFGTDFLKDLVRSPYQGISSIDRVLQQYSAGITFTELYHDWVIANVGHNVLPANPATEKYRYNENTLPAIGTDLTISQFPAIDVNAQIKNLGMSVVRFFGGEDLSVQFSAPSELTVDGTLILSDGTSWDVVKNFDLGSSNPDFSLYNDYGTGWFIVSSPTVKSPEDTSDFGIYSMIIDGSGGRTLETLDYTSGEISFPITLGGANAVINFELPAPETEILSAEVFLGTRDSVRFTLKETADSETLGSVLLTEPSLGWNIWNLDTLNLSLSSVYLAVQSLNNAVGYDSVGGYSGNSYLQLADGDPLRALPDFTIASGDTLFGDWSIRLNVAYPGSGDNRDPGPVVLRNNPWIASSELHGRDVTLTLLFDKAGEVRIDIFNILGQHVKTIYNDQVLQGNQAFQVKWNGTNKNGVRVSNGMYFIAVRKDGEQQVKKLSLLW